MPSAIGHALFALSLCTFRPFRTKLLTVILLTVFCAILPDFDVIGFELGIKYSDMLAHRGFTHYILFVILFSMLVTKIFFRAETSSNTPFISSCWYFFVCTMSHGVLDAMTDGGLGVGFFIPFSAERIFFSYRPIPVSPLNLSSFFSSHGWYILKQELLFIGMMSIMISIAGYFWRKNVFDRN